MTVYLIDGQKISSTSQNFQTILEHCRDQQITVYCACKRPNPVVVIAKTKGVCFVRRRPKDGASHSPRCSHFALPPSVSGHHTIADATTDLEDGKMKIRITARLSQQGSRVQAERHTDPDNAVRSASQKQASLRALGEYLFERSGLTQWQPEFKERRGYEAVRRRLYAAAENILLSSGELSSRLFIPEAYQSQNKDGQEEEARDWFEKFGVDLPGKQFALLIAELRGVSETEYGGRLDLKHLYNRMFFLDSTAYLKTLEKLDSLENRFAGSNWTKNIVVATCEWRGRYAMIQELDIIKVNKNFIPIYSSAEENGLWKFENNFFNKSLRFDERCNQIIASLVLTDQEPNVAVFFCARNAPNKQEIYSAAQGCEMAARVVEI